MTVTKSLWHVTGSKWVDTDPEVDVIALTVSGHGKEYAVSCAGPKGMKSNEFILHDESVTWFSCDVHAAAYTNLDGPLGKQMGKLLGYDVMKAPQCMACHSADMSPRKPLADNSLRVPKVWALRAFARSLVGSFRQMRRDRFRRTPKGFEPSPQSGSPMRFK